MIHLLLRQWRLLWTERSSVAGLLLGVWKVKVPAFIP